MNTEFDYGYTADALAMNTEFDHAYTADEGV